MGQPSKRKNKYTFTMALEKSDGTVKKHTVGQGGMEVAAVILIALAVGIICKFILDSITIKEARNEIINQTITINDLTDENEALSALNSTLTDKMAVLGEAVSQKAEAEDAISQRIMENALPKGLPLSGPAPMEEVVGREPMVVFTAANGTNVVTSGTGVVVSVEADEMYGTRIVIDHGNGCESIYRNAGTALVKDGQTIGKGYILFTVGKDNQKLGYQIMQNGQFVDPMLFINMDG